MRVLTVAMQKGGVGKTTTAVNLSAALALQGKRVLLVDTDPQANATSWLGLEPESGLFDWFAAGCSTPVVDLVRETTTDGLDVLPSGPALYGVDAVLRDEVGAETLLREALQRLEVGAYDVVVIDSAPGTSLLTVNALAAAHVVLAPVIASAMSVDALHRVQQVVRKVSERLNPDLRRLVVLATRVDARTTHSTEVHAQLRRAVGKSFLEAYVRENVAVSRAYGEDQTVFDYDPRSHAAQDYYALAEEVAAILDKMPRLKTR